MKIFLSVALMVTVLTVSILVNISGTNSTVSKVMAQSLTCPIDPTGKIIVNFPDDTWLASDPFWSRPETPPVSTSIPAGNYRVTLASYDSHDKGGGVYDVTQPDERWYVKLQNSSGTDVAISNSSTDIPDTVDWLVDEVNTSLNIPEDVYTLIGVHTTYPDNSDANSMNVVCAAFENVSGPVPTPTPTPIISTPTPTSPPTPTPTGAYTIRGNVYVDSNRNQTKDGIETNYSSGTNVSLSGSASRTTTTDSSGNYVFSGLYDGNYTVTFSVPGGYMNTSPITNTIVFP